MPPEAVSCGGAAREAARILSRRCDNIVGTPCEDSGTPRGGARTRTTSKRPCNSRRRPGHEAALVERRKQVHCGREGPARAVQEPVTVAGEEGPGFRGSENCIYEGSSGCVGGLPRGPAGGARGVEDTTRAGFPRLPGRWDRRPTLRNPCPEKKRSEPFRALFEESNTGADAQQGPDTVHGRQPAADYRAVGWSSMRPGGFRVSGEIRNGLNPGQRRRKHHAHITQAGGD